jgi:hypothetical protein
VEVHIKKLAQRASVFLQPLTPAQAAIEAGRQSQTVALAAGASEDVAAFAGEMRR